MCGSKDVMVFTACLTKKLVCMIGWTKIQNWYVDSIDQKQSRHGVGFDVKTKMQLSNLQSRLHRTQVLMGLHFDEG